MKHIIPIMVILLLLSSGFVGVSYSTDDIEQSTMPTPLGNILYVGGNGTGNYSKIQDAINDSVDGDTVFVFDDRSPYYENIEIEKSINLVGENKNTTIIDGNRLGDVVYISADWVNITGFTIQRGGSHPYSGIRTYSNFNCFSYNNIVNNLHGIHLRGSNNTIIGNNASNNNNGIYLGTYSNNNMIIGNNVKSNKNNVGIYLVYYSNSNTIIGNNLSDNDYGIKLATYSNNNLISGNNASNNGHAISLQYSHSNMIIGNNASNNFIGIFLQFSSNNLLYHNNLINSSDVNAFDDEINIWYNSTIQQGNYYDDYSGVDDDGDGIGDTPYPIPYKDNVDMYPLMVPFPCDENYAPSKPFIDGPLNGKPGIEYEYTFKSTDINGDAVKYVIYWGDNTNTGWIGPYDSGTEVTKSHTWSEKDNYTIQAKAKDVLGEESDWAYLEVSMPMNQQSQNWWFLQFLQNHPRMFPILQQLLGL